jgi:hypothetical protein
MDDIIEYSNNDTPYSLTEKIIKENGGILPIKIAFENDKLAKAIINNSPIKNLEIGVADWMIEGLILGGIPPGKFRELNKEETNSNTKPYSIILTYEKHL